MSKTESPLRELAHPDGAGAAAPSAQVIDMTELGSPGSGVEPLNGVEHPTPAALGDLHAALRDVKARLTVCVGSAEMTVGELLGAREQQVLRLDRAVDQPVDVLLEGKVVARGTLVAVDDHFAVRITELPSRAADPEPSPGQR